MGGRSVVRVLRVVAPSVWAVAALAGMAVTVVSLLGTPAVDIGIFRSESHDALSLYLGHGIYHDPAGNGYTGLLYTPLLPTLVAGLDYVQLWNGWPVIVTVVATAALGLLVARLAYASAPGRGISAALGAAGMGGAAVWLATSAVGLLYFGWADELAWALALAGLVVGARAHRSIAAAVAAVLLLTLAFWAKQTTIAASLAFAVWLGILTIRGERSARLTVTLIGSLLGVNLVVLGALALATGGWEPYFNLVLPTRQSRIYGLHTFVTDLLTRLSAPAAWAAGLGAVALVRRGRRARLDSVAALLIVFVVAGIPLALYFRSKQGGNPNQYIGVIWAMSTLGALAWAAAGRGRRRALADGIVAVALAGAVAATAVGANRFDLRDLRLRYPYSVPADLRALAARATVFHPAYTDLSRGEVFPDMFNASDLLASGKQPMGLVRALLWQRFQYATTYLSTVGAANRDFLDTYASGYGRYEAHYFWKLDQVIDAGYEPAAGLPSGLLKRRPGADRAARLAACFGPFRLAGATWTIRAGGGFWCRGSGPVIALGSAPVALSELVSDASLVGSGTLRMAGNRGASIHLIRGTGWIVDAQRGMQGWNVVLRRPGAAPALRRTRTPILALDLGAGSGIAAGHDTAPGRISIVASASKGVRIDASQLRVAR